MEAWNVSVRLSQLSLAVLRADAKAHGLTSKELVSPEVERQQLIDLLRGYYQRYAQGAGHGGIFVSDLSKPAILALAKEYGLVPSETEWKDVPRDIYDQVASVMERQPSSAGPNQTQSLAETVSAKSPTIESRPSWWRTWWSRISVRFGLAADSE